MYWRFGAQGIGTTFHPIGIIKADDKATAILKMNNWTKEQTDEYLNSFLLPHERCSEAKRPDIVLDWEVNNYIQVVIE